MPQNSWVGGGRGGRPIWLCATHMRIPGENPRLTLAAGAHAPKNPPAPNNMIIGDGTHAFLYCKGKLPLIHLRPPLVLTCGAAARWHAKSSSASPTYRTRTNLRLEIITKHVQIYMTIIFRSLKFDFIRISGACKLIFSCTERRSKAQANDCCMHAVMVPG